MLPKASFPSERYGNVLQATYEEDLEMPSSAICRNDSSSIKNRERNYHQTRNYHGQPQGTPVVLGEIRDPKRKNQSSGKLKKISKSLSQFWSDVKYHTSFLRSQRKIIECRFGSGVASFFNFIGWLIQLNVLMSIIMLTVLVIPQHVLKPWKFNDSVVINFKDLNNYTYKQKYQEKVLQCSANYQNYLTDIMKEQSTLQNILNVIDGIGIFEKSPLFIGYYFDKHLYSAETNDVNKSIYSMPVAWFLVYVVSVIITIVLSMLSHKKSYKKSLSADDLVENSAMTFTNMVFSAWDYSQNNARQSILSQNNIVISLKAELANQRDIRKAYQRSKLKWLLIYIIRILMNIFLLGAMFGIFHFIDFVYKKKEELGRRDDLQYFVQMLVQYLPALSIFGINTAFLFVVKLIVLEKYSASTEISLKLARTVAVRLIALMYFMMQLIKKLKPDSKADCGATDKTSQCWETKIGQEMYRMAVLHFITGAFIGPITELLRSLVDRCLRKKVKFLEGKLVAVFDIPLRALDLVYLQTVVWLGFFFFPFLPVFAAINLLFTFFAREILLIFHHNTVDIRTYQATRSERYFVDILIYTLALSMPMIIYMFTEFPRSLSCSPFRMYYSPSNSTILNAFLYEIDLNSSSFKSILLIISHKVALIIYLLILILLLLRELLQSKARDSVIRLLSKEVVARSQDRKFLFHRLQDVLHTATLMKHSKTKC